MNDQQGAALAIIAPLKPLFGPLTTEDCEALADARRRLSGPGLAVRLADALGTPVEALARVLPERLRERLDRAVEKAMQRALGAALSSLRPLPSAMRTHRLLGGVSGAVGGFFGLPALALELPVSTVLMLRAIADIARREGEDLDDIEARLACLEVFALGGPGKGDDAAETGYWTSRLALGQMVGEAQRHIVHQGLSAGGPALSSAIHQIVSRFGVAVSNKAAAQLVPVIGAAGGAALNLAFLAHFESIARGHFTIRRLERRYGTENVAMAYAAQTGG